jgi:quercetin dioxygenase-like cupin family protein
MAEASPAHREGRFADLERERPYPGLAKRTFDAEGATVNSYEFEPGAEFPLHHHDQEQVTLVTEGEVRMTVGDSVSNLDAGSWNVVPGGMPHGITAGPEGAVILAIIVPRRGTLDSLKIVEAN